jgi:hypothetical protein
MTPTKLRRKTKSLFRLVRLQRTFRLLLRSAWIGGAGYLLGWGINAFWGYLPDAKIWIWLGGLLAFINIFFIFFHPVSQKQFTWNLDRKLGLKEQLSAAVDLGVGDEGEISDLLIDDASKLVPELRKRIVERGWKVRGEFEAGLVVLILLMMVYLSGIGTLPSFIPGGFGFLPGLGQDPSMDGIFPSGLPGITPGEARQLGLGIGDSNGETSFPVMTPQELGEISDVLSEMGESLEKNVSTNDIGKALQQGEYKRAADEISALAENLDTLSEETRQNIEESIQNAVDQLEQPGQQDLVDALQGASDAIEAKGDLNAGAELDELASQIESFGVKITEGRTDSIGVGELETGEIFTFERIMGEGETFDLSVYGEPSSLLHPPEGPSDNTNLIGGGEFDYIAPTNGSLIEGMLNPYNISWEKRNVVTAYFTP